MEFIRPGIAIDFVGKRRTALLISSVIILISLIGMFIYPRPNPGIDFAGGTEVQVLFLENVEMGRVRNAVEELKLGEVQVQKFGGGEVGGAYENEYLIRVEKLEETEENKPDAEAAGISTNKAGKSASVIEAKLDEEFGNDSYEVRQVNFVGKKVGDELTKRGLLAIGWSLVLILLYITLRFEFQYAMGAILALVHDVIITTGAIVFAMKEFNLALIAALLTIVGYSLNDTIVVYDRIREKTKNKKISDIRRAELNSQVNSSVNETLSRTVLTSMTTLLVLLCLWLFGGGVIHDFAYALMVGVAVGTYSSIFVASSYVIYAKELQKKYEAKR